MTITTDEQDAIAAFLANNAPRVIPMGVCSTNLTKAPQRPGRPRNVAAIARVRTLAAAGWPDSEIARAIGNTRSAVSNIRHRYGIEAGVFQRRAA